MNKYTQTITGARLRTLRLARGWTQEKLVNRARKFVPAGRILARESVSRYETGATGADEWTLEAFARALDTSVAYLRGRTADPRPMGETAFPFPVPEPDLWPLVTRLNGLTPQVRSEAVEVLKAATDYALALASSYLRETSARFAADASSAAPEYIPADVAVLQAMVQTPELRELLSRRLVEAAEHAPDHATFAQADSGG